MVPVIVVLLIIGSVLILASFIFHDSFSDRSGRKVLTESEIEHLVERRFHEVKYQLDDEAEKSADIIKDQTESELEKLSNEKIMAVNEYSDQVMDQINKNHNEVMFLYNMLSEKQKELDHAVDKLNRVKQRAEDEEKLAEHAKEEQKQQMEVQESQPVRQSETQEAAAKKDGKDLQSDEKYANKEQIMQLYKQGCSSLEIARRLRLGIGEVQLVIGLSRESQE